LWEAFLQRVTNDNGELRGYLHRAAGYSLTGDVSEQCLFFAYGIGANGKSTYFDVLMQVLGDYAQKGPRELLLLRRGDSVPTEVARLKGSRFVVSAEVSENGRLNEAQIKDLTGGDRLVARFMHRDFFEFNATHKLWIYGNHKPVIRGTDHGIWRRILLIPFEVCIPPEEQDGHLKDKLAAELPGILAWAVRGCLEWQRQGLQPPPEVLCATEDYRQQMDVLGQFISDCCCLGPKLTAGSSLLYAVYKEWCEKAGEHVRSQRWLGMQLRDRGFVGVRPHGGRVAYQGIGIKEPIPTAPEFD